MDRPSYKFLFCDCCNKQPIAVEYEDKIVVKSRAHGREHTLTIPKVLTTAVPRAQYVVTTE
jgi:hypothetical protein